MPNAAISPASSDIFVHPNPVGDMLEVNIVGDRSIDNVIIYNHLGKAVLETNQNPMNVSNLPTGIYTIIALSDRTRYIQKLVIQR